MSNDAEFYEKDGRRYERISHILDYFCPPALLKWKLRVGNKEANAISRAALKIGTNVDECARALCRGDVKLPKLATLEAKNCWEAFRQWQIDYNVSGLVELDTLYDDINCVAGTPDFYWPEQDCIIDMKCSSKIRPQYWLQTEFYSRCKGAQNKAVLRLDKNLAIFDFKQMSISDEHWSATVGLINAHRYFALNEGERKEENECSNSSTSVGTSNAT